MDAATPMIEVKDVVQRFGRKTPFGDTTRTVLDHVNLNVARASMLCLLGPSGCGKTTLVNLIMGETVPRSGEVRVMGELAPFPTARASIGFMPQGEALYDDITAEENLRFFGIMNGLAGNALARRIDEMLAFSRLEGDRAHLVSSFSGGMKRRLSLAVALLHEPDLLVLDEPTVGLDPSHRRRIWAAFADLAHAGTTLLVTTHVMDEAAHCSRIAMLNEGRIIASGSPAAIMQQTGTPNLEEAFLILEKGVRHA